MFGEVIVCISSCFKVLILYHKTLPRVLAVNQAAPVSFYTREWRWIGKLTLNFKIIIIRKPIMTLTAAVFALDKAHCNTRLSKQCADPTQTH